MARILDLRLIFQLIIDRLDDEALTQQLVAHPQQAIFHVGFDPGNELESLFQQRLEERLREIPFIAKELSEQDSRQLGNGFTLIHIPRRERESEDSVVFVDDQMEFESVKPA